jgi:5'-nucleotidase/UDP-sugar diphosphatase
MRHAITCLVALFLSIAPAPALHAQAGPSTQLRAGPSTPLRAGGATVTILHFNDVYEITPVEAGKSGGLARVAAVRARLKAQHPGLITTLGGDYLSPSALGTARVNGERLAGRQMVGVLNVLGLDWATFGNHEFDVPEAALRARLAESRFHLVSSNVTDASGAVFPGTVTHAVVPVTTDAGTVRVGLIGLTIDANRQPWVRYAPPVESARAAIAELKGKSDVIVALTHLALAGDQQVAEEVPEIDLILGGHEHENWLIERGPHFTPIVKADANVRTVAVVTLRIPRTGARPVVSARLERIDDRIREHPRTAAEVRKWTEVGFQGFKADGFDPAGVITTVTVALDGRESAVRNRSTSLTELITDAMRHEAATEIGIFNGGSIRIDDVLSPGRVTQYDVIRVLPFGGKVLKATFTGALLSHVLQVGEQNKGTGGFLHAAGLPAAIDPKAHYTLAISDFLLTGGEANLGFLTRQNPDVSDVSELRDVRMAVIDELKKRFPVK